MILIILFRQLKGLYFKIIFKLICVLFFVVILFEYGLKRRCVWLEKGTQFEVEEFSASLAYSGTDYNSGLRLKHVTS